MTKIGATLYFTRFVLSKLISSWSWLNCWCKYLKDQKSVLSSMLGKKPSHVWLINIITCDKIYIYIYSSLLYLNAKLIVVVFAVDEQWGTENMFKDKQTCSPCREHLCLKSVCRHCPRCGSFPHWDGEPSAGTHHAPLARPEARRTGTSHHAPKPRSAATQNTLFKYMNGDFIY